MVIKPKIRISVYSSKKFSFCLVSLFGQMSVKPFYLFTWKLFHGCQNLDRGKIGCFQKFGQPQLIHNSTKGVITCQEVWTAFFLLCFSPPSFFFLPYMMKSSLQTVVFLSLDYLWLILTFVLQFKTCKEIGKGGNAFSWPCICSSWWPLK